MRLDLTCLAAVAALSLILSGCAASTKGLPEGVSAVEATWLYGQYAIPAQYSTTGFNEYYGGRTTSTKVTSSIWSDEAAKNIKPGVRMPSVLYLHGCRHSHDEISYQKLLLDEGFAVWRPDSWARPGRKAYCGDGNRYKHVLRREEMTLALEKLHQLPWVDKDRIVVMGYSEGGGAIATWAQPGFAGHIIIGSDCWAAGDFGAAPKAPAGTPVLNIIGENDEYYAPHAGPGSHCAVDKSVQHSDVIVIPDAMHSVHSYPVTRNAIKSFIHAVAGE